MDTIVAFSGVRGLPIFTRQEEKEEEIVSLLMRMNKAVTVCREVRWWRLVPSVMKQAEAGIGGKVRYRRI